MKKQVYFLYSNEKSLVASYDDSHDLNIRANPLQLETLVNGGILVAHYMDSKKVWAIVNGRICSEVSK